MSRKTMAESAPDYINDLIKNNSLQVFRGLYGGLWATVIEDGKSKTIPLESSKWGAYLSRYSSDNDLSMSAQLKEEITSQLCATAENSQKKSVDIRVARDVDSVQVDLNDDTHDAIHISETKRGFSLGQPKNVSFHRPMKQQPLPRPVLIETSDFIKRFKKFMPEFAFGHWILILAFILKSLNRNRGSFPILRIEGPQGSGKTMFSRFIKALIDPSDPPELSPPRNIDDIIVAAQNSYVLLLDNISGFSHYMADMLCRLATGGGIAKRKLYTDHDEAIYKILRPIIINGIDDPSHRPDFLDRCILVELQPIAEGKRVAETELNKEFEANYPELLGGLYSLLSECLKVLPTITENNLPRMTDFALMGIAIERVLNLKPGYFLRVYNKNRNEQTENTFWNDELCSAIFETLNSQKKQQVESVVTESGTPIKRSVWVTDSTPLQGTAQELSQKLFKQGKFSNQKPPKGRSFSGWLKRVEPLLNKMDIVVERPPRSAGKRTIIIRWADRPEWMDL